MKHELDALLANQTFILAPLRTNLRVINLSWVFSKKRDLDGCSICKARLVAKGFSQVRGIDYNATFAPVSSLDTIRLFLAITCFRNYRIEQLDINNAFLNGELKEEFYLKLPDGIVGADNQVCELGKSIYGLKQSPREWNKTFDSIGSVDISVLIMNLVYIQEKMQK